MYVDHSLCGDPMNDGFVDELNFKNCVRLKRKKTSKLFFGITYNKRKFIIHPEYFDANIIFSRPFIQNIKHKPKIIQDLSIKLKISLKKQILENSVKQKIHQIICITSKNG